MPIDIARVHLTGDEIRLREDASLLGANGYVEISRALWEGRGDDARRFAYAAGAARAEAATKQRYFDAFAVAAANARSKP